jgi:hypothetical protein
MLAASLRDLAQRTASSFVSVSAPQMAAAAS